MQQPEVVIQAGRLECSWQDHGAAAVLAARGEVDLATADVLAQALAAAPPNVDVVVDLTGVTFIDSTGITALIVGHRAALEGRIGYALVAPAGPVRRVLQVSGLDRVVPVHGTIRDALP